MVRTAVAVDQTLVLGTPVDTGQARGGWQVGLGGPVTEDSGRLDKSGQATVAANNAEIAGRRPGQDIFLSNNVEHIVPLNQGSSSQAPEGFVEEAIQVGVNAVRGARILR